RVKRDGRAVALTYMNPEHFADASNPALRGGGSGASRDAERLPSQAAAREWLRSNEEAEALMAGVAGERKLEVSYESLCADVEGTLRRIFTFLGVDAMAQRPDFRAATHHVIGNGMRLDSGSEVRLDERWRNALSAAELRTFDLVAGAMNRRLGYT
ncbi:MAG: sulfotransferase, partial [Gammaproteobacteria bacterium]|nr:sulfotransferase [Gammaproteobacteria bacterium]